MWSAQRGSFRVCSTCNIHSASGIALRWCRTLGVQAQGAARARYGQALHTAQTCSCERSSDSRLDRACSWLPNVRRSTASTASRGFQVSVRAPSIPPHFFSSMPERIRSPTGHVTLMSSSCDAQVNIVECVCCYSGQRVRHRAGWLEKIDSMTSWSSTSYTLIARLNFFAVFCRLPADMGSTGHSAGTSNVGWSGGADHSTPSTAEACELMTHL